MKRLCVVFVLLLVGCNDPYGGCVKASSSIANGIKAGMTLVDTTRVQGLITPQDELNVLGYLKFANDANANFQQCTATVHSQGSKVGAYTACATTFLNELNNPTELALVHLDGQKAKVPVGIADGILAAVNLVITQLGGA